MGSPVESGPGYIGFPLRLAPTFDHKPWGGRRLESFGKQLPDGLIGESLESGPLASISGGRFDGVTLRDLAAREPQALLGKRGMAAASELHDFPLLIKLIDAHEDLSVQVHPSDEHAPEGARGKTEAWLILESAPGGSLVIGVDGVPNPEHLHRQIVRVPVVAGDVFLVPAGTIHAIGAGVLLYEIQQNSDITYRLYDWGRAREMHLERGFAVADASSRATRVQPLCAGPTREILVACCHFALERWRITQMQHVRGDGQSCKILTVLDGTLLIGSESYERGISVVLPADLTATALSGDAVVLAGYVADLEREIVAPLRARGHSEMQIRALGIDVR